MASGQGLPAASVRLRFASTPPVGAATGGPAWHSPPVAFPAAPAVANETAPPVAGCSSAAAATAVAVEPSLPSSGLLGGHLLFFRPQAPVGKT